MSVTLHSLRAVDRIKSDMIAATVIARLQEGLTSDAPPVIRMVIEELQFLLTAGLSPEDMRRAMARLQAQLARAKVRW